MGGKLGGVVRSVAGAGAAPRPDSLAPPAFEVLSAPLAEVIRDINKYSNNVMAQQLFLSLSLPAAGSGADVSGKIEPVALARASRSTSRERLVRWWHQRMGEAAAPVIDNGSGLSRSDRISASALGRLLQSAYQSPWMPELMASLPIVGIDGTLKNRPTRDPGRAHLKSGSLRDVNAVAGYVLADSGTRYVLVAIVNHPNARAARAALDALLEWTVQDR